jgi:arabinogalactan endo-1,4-beta-galactosidase
MQAATLIYNVDIHKVKWYSRRVNDWHEARRVCVVLPGLLLALVFSVLLGASSNARPPGRNGNFRVALSVSPFAEIVLSNGTVFTDGKITAKSVEDLQRLFVAHGATEAYARIATSREKTAGFGDHSLNRGLMRARLAKSLGLPFNPELGLFKFYGDVRCQPSPDFSEYPELKVPGLWTSLTLEQMLPVLRSYGAVVAKVILDTGVKVNVWDLGNEVDFGVAGVSPGPLPDSCDDSLGPSWYRPPNGVDPEIGKQAVLDLLKLPESERVAWLQAHVWPYEAQILAAVAEGIRSVNPAAKFSTHVSGILAVRSSEAVAFFAAMKKGGYVPDQLGFSFYPSSTAEPADRLQAFKNTIAAVSGEFRRPVFIAEFAYPAAEKAASEGPFASWNHALDHYPLTPQGQADVLRDLASWGVADGVSGIRPWAPDTPVAAWDSFALFSSDGKVATARPGLSVIAEGARTKP